MAIEVSEIQRIFRYNGMTLPDVPGMTPREVRDLYSAQYHELISAEVEAAEVVNGTQEYTFRKAVGIKGRTGVEGEHLAAFKATVELEAAGGVGSTGKLARALGCCLILTYYRSAPTVCSVLNGRSLLVRAVRLALRSAVWISERTLARGGRRNV